MIQQKKKRAVALSQKFVGTAEEEEKRVRNGKKQEALKFRVEKKVSRVVSPRSKNEVLNANDISALVMRNRLSSF